MLKAHNARRREKSRRGARKRSQFVERKRAICFRSQESVNVKSTEKKWKTDNPKERPTVGPVGDERIHLDSPFPSIMISQSILRFHILILPYT